jgi:hypothetical protein
MKSVNCHLGLFRVARGKAIRKCYEQDYAWVPLSLTVQGQ